MRNQRGKGPENPGRLLKRLMGMLMKHYGTAVIIVAICIIINVLANVQGTMFMQRLIDDYITPLLKSETKNYTPLLHAIGRVACFYGIGIIASYSYNRIMVNVTQGMLKTFRDSMFTKMEQLPIKYFDTHAHGDIMSMYTNDTDTLRQMISQSMPQLFNSAITIIKYDRLYVYAEHSAYGADIFHGRNYAGTDKKDRWTFREAFHCAAEGYWYGQWLYRRDDAGTACG